MTPYHALPTTTTLCAKVDGQVVGTLSIVREGVFGFPMQSVFDIASVRAKEGHIAEISALAIHPRWRKTGGSILFPLMKFMYGYCTRYFDTRHLVIAVNPAHIEMYESMLFFRRLTEQVVDRYDFVNGAPAVGATLDLHEAPTLFERAYGHKPGRRNLHRYFVHTELPEIHYPPRPWHTSNDPVLSPALMDYFFNQRTRGFEGMDDHRKRLLHSIYREPEWAAVLPPLPPAPKSGIALRRYARHSMKCPASLDSGGLPGRAVGGDPGRYLGPWIHGPGAAPAAAGHALCRGGGTGRRAWRATCEAEVVRNAHQRWRPVLRLSCRAPRRGVAALRGLAGRGRGASRAAPPQRQTVPATAESPALQG